jgi:signal transduction histidine kinase
VTLAANLAHARYGALAVFSPDGRVEEFATFGVTEAERARIGALPSHRGLLGQIGRRGSLRLEDVQRAPEFTGIPAGHPAFHTFLGVAVRWREDVLGHLYLGGHVGETPFSADEERLLRMFATHAALAITRHRLQAAYARAALGAERRRIAMGLHDQTLQGLYALALQLGRARRQGLAELTESMTVDEAVAALDRSMASLRAMLDSLEGEGGTDCPDTIGWAAPPDGPAADVRAVVEEAAVLLGVRVLWHGQEALEYLAPPVRREVATCLREMVTNAARHGRAGRVEVTVRAGDPLAIDVCDDGIGAEAMAAVPGHGLAHITARVSALGGTVRFEGREGGGGAGVHIRLPIDTVPAPKGGGGHGSDSDRR